MDVGRIVFRDRRQAVQSAQGLGLADHLAAGRPGSVALSKEQYQALKQAIDNWRELQEILCRMQALSRQVIFETLPNPPRRKRLGKKVLGLN